MSVLTPTVFAPLDEAELADTIREAAASRTSLEIAGGGTRATLGRPVQAEHTLSTRNLSGIRLYEPGALTLVVGAGTKLAEIETLLAEHGQMLPFEPIDHRTLLGTGGEPTIGGAVAVNASGPRRIQQGACRDAMIGVRFIDGQGRIIANGGRVMKNVTGYDLVKLMAGSFGTLGIITEIAFKLLPLPEASATLRLHGLDEKQAVAAMATALGLSTHVSGAAHLPEPGPQNAAPLTLIRVDGMRGTIAERVASLEDRLARFSPDGIETGEDCAKLWRQIRDVAPLATRKGAIWRVSLRPSLAPEFVAAIRGQLTLDGVLYDWGGGLVWLLLPERGDAGATVIRAATARFGGHATLVRASAETRAAVEVFEPEPPTLARISADLRHKFDPHAILNQGRIRG